MDRDFTLAAYSMIIDAALAAGYQTTTVVDWHEKHANGEYCVMLRHDVDRHPENAVAMARIEAARGVKASYYFRIVPESFVPRDIEAIRDMGHEIGYHYEDWHLAGADKAKATEMFATHLEQLRKLAPIRSIAMHGSPLARENNMMIWQHADFTQYGVIDAILSFDYTGYTFFTDSGRTFGPSGANLRDYLGNARTIQTVRSSHELVLWLQANIDQRVQINVHPERWSDATWPWYRQWLWDCAANSAKRLIRLARAPKP